MAHTINVTKLLDGPRHVIVHVYLKSDGISSDLKDVILVDPNTDDVEPKIGSKPSFVVEEIMYDFAGFDATVKFDSGLINDNYVWVLPEGAVCRVDFTPYGGFKDRSGLDGTGSLMIDTFGLLSVGDQGSILIKLRKSSQ